MTLKLTPRALGEVTVNLQMSEGRVSGEMRVDNEVARGLLVDGLKELRAALEARGVTVERLTVERSASPEPAETGTADRSSQREPGAQGGRDDGSNAPGEDGRSGDPDGHQRGNGSRDEQLDRGSDGLTDGREAEPGSALADDGVVTEELDESGELVLRLDAVA